jgi:hypothetical protein
MLACGFAASLALAEQARSTQAIAHLRRTFELSEVSRRLIAIAVIVRSILDLQEDWTKLILDDAMDTVGELIPDASNPTKKQALKLREACNKIIHSHDVFYDFLESDGEELGGLLPKVTLRGERRTALGGSFEHLRLHRCIAQGYMITQLLRVCRAR